jgi:hypothetical protein
MSPLDRKVTVNVNINDIVHVKLTEAGRNYIRSQPELWAGLPPEDKEGWSRWHMWDLMLTFGRFLVVTEQDPFQTTIKIEVKEADLMIGILSS